VWYLRVLDIEYCDSVPPGGWMRITACAASPVRRRLCGVACAASSERSHCNTAGCELSSRTQNIPVLNQ
jgi:hypothetical protein